MCVTWVGENSGSGLPAGSNCEPVLRATLFGDSILRSVAPGWRGCRRAAMQKPVHIVDGTPRVSLQEPARPERRRGLPEVSGSGLSPAAIPARNAGA